MSEGEAAADGAAIAIIVSKYHDFVTDRLQAGALAALSAAGVKPDDVTVLQVPGAFEIPFAARRAAETGRFQAIVCLGCLIRGATPHFEYIASGRGARAHRCRGGDRRADDVWRAHDQLGRGSARAGGRGTLQQRVGGRDGRRRDGRSRRAGSGDNP